MFEILRRPLIKLSLVAAIVFSVTYVYYVFFDFILSLVYYAKINIPSLTYTVLRVTTILFPLILFTPFSRKNTMVSKFRILYIIMGACYLLGNTWVFYYLAGNPVSALFDINQLIITQYNNGLVMNYLLWNCYTLWSVLFSTMQGILYLVLAKKITQRRKPALILGGVILFLATAAPLLYSVLDPTLHSIDQMLRENVYITSVQWIRKDIYILLSQFFVYLALLIAGSNHYEWNEFLWQ